MKQRKSSADRFNFGYAEILNGDFGPPTILGDADRWRSDFTMEGDDSKVVGVYETCS